MKPTMVRAWWHSGLWFGLVGASAAAVHLLVFELARRVVPPEWANVAGFLVAFGLSFSGHRWLSFKGTRTGLQQSLLRFALTAVAGFGTNELCFVLALRVMDWPIWPSLLLALLLASGQTFLLGRFWAFRR